jgi:hypothetical protein
LCRKEYNCTEKSKLRKNGSNLEKKSPKLIKNSVKIFKKDLRESKKESKLEIKKEITSSTEELIKKKKLKNKSLKFKFNELI